MMRALLFILLALAAIPARAADCTAPAAPGVDWQRCLLDGRDLARHDLSRSRLRETSFQRANLKGATLVAVDAYRVRFVSADLAGAILDDGRFIEGDFTKTDLSGASLQRADLSRTKFFRASLRGANLTGAKVSGADLLNADLSGARWIDGQRVCGDHSIGQCN